MAMQEPGLAGNADTKAEGADWGGTERFEVVRCIGRGGMGTVYEARDRERKQRVAIKTLLHFSPATLFMFKQEFRTLADVHHPNLVRLHELVAADGQQVFFSMELVRGVDFRTHVLRPGIGAAGGEASASVTLELGADLASQRQVRSAPPAEGEGLARPRRASPAADIDRLRPALKQLIEGVQALHDAGKLHRDIKPSNVLVTPEGRVVILDFGVATDLPRVADATLREEGHVVGTARYMAPEQALDEDPTAACDWYSVGVMLYEALVGTPPFVGTTAEVLQAKNSIDAPTPSQIVDGVPGDLDAICVALLDRDPARRPGGRELLRRMGAMRASLPAPALAGASPGGALLVGRERELGALREAFELARAQRTVAMYVSGRAGMGKSVLVQRFLDGLVDAGEAAVLRGRAYERESVPYKAVDAVIDALSRHLMHVSDNEGTMVLPHGMDALARLFPVLRRVPAVNDVAQQPAGDPAQVRRRAFHALRELVSSLAARRPLVIYVDDVQWGDTDSAGLLLELVRPPHAPPIMLIMSHREEEATDASFLKEMRAKWPAGVETHEVSVGPLALDAACRLSLAILGSRDAAAHAIAEASGRESEGNPFLVEELSRSSTGRTSAARSERLTLEQMIADRLGRLPEEARRMAEIVAVGGRPLPLSAVGDAAEIASTDDVVALLAMRRFVRTGLRDGREVIEPIHDRVRETIVAMLAEPDLRAHHGRLARVLEATPGADPEAVAVHLLGAGETKRGARFARKAAEHAITVLAFDQAARLFRLAIKNMADDSPKVGPLYARLGEVLGWAGRNEEAGRAYIAAAERATGVDRVAHERAASAQLLAAGHIDEGGVMLRRVLASVGVDAPKSPMATVASLLAYKARLRVLGLGFDERKPEDVPAADGARIDALHVAALGLASVDIVLATCMQARQFVEALRSGDRARIVRAATLYYGSHLATRGGPVSAHERDVHALIVRLVEKGGSPIEAAFSRGTHGVGLFLRGHWREAVEVIDGAYVNLPSQMAGMQAQAALYGVYAQAFLGNLVELRRRQERLLADAEQRGDLFMAVLLRVSHPVLLVLADDDPNAARDQVRAAKARWSHGKFLIQDWQVTRSEAEIELYAGNGGAAWNRLELDRRPLEKSLLLRVQFMRVLTEFARGRAAIASIVAAPERKAAQLAEANKSARQLRGERMKWTDPLAATVTASIKSVEGDRAGAESALREAIALAEGADMTLYAAAARYQLALSLGKVVGADFLREAEARMGDQGIRAPSRFASMLVPGDWGDDRTRS